MTGVVVRLTLLAVLAVALPLAFRGVGASANGVAQLVKLTYLEDVSNTGPQDAEGPLEFSLAEAFARVEVKRLIAGEGRTFEGWLLGASDPQLVGEIPVDATGLGGLETTIPGLAPDGEYNLFVIAVRTAETEEGAVPTEISIAGRFTIIQNTPEAGVAGDTQPGILPETGERVPGGIGSRIFFTIAVMGGLTTAIGAVMAIKRKREQA